MGQIELLRVTLLAHKLVFVDTMLFIYLLEDVQPYAELAATLFEVIEGGETNGCTSSMTLAELLTAPAKAQDSQGMADLEIFVTHFPNLTVWPLETALAREIARIRAATGLRTPDAVQIATAQASGASVIVTNDKRWRKKTGGIECLILDDFIGSDSAAG